MAKLIYFETNILALHLEVQRNRIYFVRSIRWLQYISVVAYWFFLW